MRSGDLKHQIIIQQPVKSKNAMGEWIETFETWATVWGAIEPASGATFYAARQLDSKVDGRIRIRYRTGIKPTMRILFGERVLSIVSVIQPKENHRELHLMYSEALD